MTKLNCGIYQIRNIVTGLCYVGQSIELNKREYYHWNNLKNNNGVENQYLQNSYNKRGKESFIFEILLYCEWSELTRYEQFFVDKYVKINLSYNICIECVDSTKGVKPSEETCKKMSENHADVNGKNNPFYDKKHSEETRKRMSEACENRLPPSEESRKRMSESQKNRGPITEETRKKLSEVNSGKNNPMFGKHPSEETRKKMREARRNRAPITEETRNRMSNAQSGENHPMFGKHHTEATCKKISEATKGKNNPMFGKHHTKETIKKTCIPKEKVLKIIKMLNDKHLQKDIAKEMNVCVLTVSKVKNGGYDDIYNLKN